MEDLRSLQGPDIAGGGQFPTATFPMSNIKPEPRGSPSPYGGSVSPYGGSVSPYGGSVSPYGGGVSPIYAPSISVSPHTQMWDTPSPTPMQPSASTAQFWNITTTSVVPNTIGEQNDLLNLDSGEIKRLVSTVDSQQSLPNLDLSFSDIIPNPDQTVNDLNMTDSLTRLTNMALDEIYQNK